MKLSEQDAKLFFDLMWSLQYFVNKKLNIHPNIKSLDEYAKCTPEQKLEVRKSLYADKKLIDEFIQENPQNFSKENLSIVSHWKNFIEGDFYIERFLKGYAIFIKERDVYEVLGLYQGFDELIHPSHLPLYVKAVLLPFKGKIVYDGLFQSYNIHFGGNIKRELKESYMIAKQTGRIIESLEPIQKENQKKEKPLKDWKQELNELADKAKILRGGSEYPATYGPAFSLIKVSIEFAQRAVSDHGDLDNLWKSLKKADRTLHNLSRILDREEYW